MRWALSALLVCAWAHQATAATLRVVDQDHDFDENGELSVQIVVEDAATLAGLEFGVLYPGDFLAVDDPTTEAAGDFLGAPVVNHEAQTTGLPEGTRRINVAVAAAEAQGVATATVLTLSFPLRCDDFGSGWPDGRSFVIGLADVQGWEIGGSGLPVAIPVTAVDGAFTANCLTVPVRDTGLSVLKFRFGAAGVHQ